MDELTNEQKILIKELSENEGFKLLQKLVDEVYDETKNQINLMAENYSAQYASNYNIFNILGCYMKACKLYEDIVSDVIHEDDKKDAVDEVEKSEEVA